MRKTAVAIVAVLVLGFVGFFMWQYTSQFPLSVPKDRTLIGLFQAHRQTFETLTEMAEKDAMIASNSTSESLSISRRSEYSRLLSQIDSKMQMGFDSTGVAFSSAHGGILLSIGPGWEKGIMYLRAVPTRVGQIVKSLDRDPGHDDLYLVPIEGDWYVFYQRTDYD
jgi:hypothetical protein